MKPILFNTNMVCAILNGQKTATRRVIKPQPEHVHTILGPSDEEGGMFEFLCGCVKGGVCLDWIKTVKMPYQPGDVLYVRETWALQQGVYWYLAGLVVYENGRDAHGTEVPQKWRPSIHMPKKAARIFLRVTDIRVERLRDITYEGCKAEGFDGEIFKDDTGGLPAIAIYRFSRLWNSTIRNKDLDRFGWDASPWVWVIEFERISRKEAERKATNENDFNH